MTLKASRDRFQEDIDDTRMAWEAAQREQKRADAERTKIPTQPQGEGS